MDNLIFVFFWGEMRNLERQHRSQRAPDHGVAARPAPAVPEILLHLPECAQHSRPIESLTLTMLAEARH